MGEARRRRQITNAAAAQGGARPRLAVCMIVKNESANLPRALESVRAVADEIVVVDTGSTDDTIPIARRFGATVGHFPWRNDFAAARNAAIDLASAVWILTLDADEQLAPESVEPLRRIVERDPSSPVFLSAETESILDSGMTAVSRLARVFPNHPTLRYFRPIHEQLTNLSGVPTPLVAAEGIRILHHGYLGVERSRKDKAERNLSLLIEATEREPANPVNWYYLGIEYGAASMHAAAADLFSRWLTQIDELLPLQCVLRARQQYAAAFVALGRGGEAADIAADGARRYNSPSLAAIAAAYLAQSDPAEAERLARSVLEFGDASSDEPMSLQSAKAVALTVLGDLEWQAGHADAARDLYAAAATADPGSTPPSLRLARLRAGTGDNAGARTLLLDVLARSPDDPATHAALTRLERELGLLQEAYDRLVEQVAKAPRELALRLDLAEVLYDAKEFALGADVLVAAEELPELAAAAPTFRTRYYERLGYGCVEAQRFDQAERAYKEAIRADPALAAKAMQMRASDAELTAAAAG